MDSATWHQAGKKNFLASGWHKNESYSHVLPNFRRMPPKSALPELSADTFRSVPVRPYSAESFRSKVRLGDNVDPVVDSIRRLYPSPGCISPPGQRIFDHYERSTAHKARDAVKHAEVLKQVQIREAAERRLDAAKKRKMQKKIRQRADDLRERGLSLEGVDEVSPVSTPEHSDEEGCASQGAQVHIGPTMTALRVAIQIQSHLANPPPVDMDSDTDSVSDDDLIRDAFFDSAFSSEAELSAVLAASPQLGRLRLSDNRWLSSGFLSGIGVMLPKLTELCLRGTNAGNGAVVTFVGACPALRIVDLSNCALLTDASPVGGLRELREFRCARSPRAATSQLVAGLKAAKRLEVLDVSFSPNLGDQGLVGLAEGCRSITHLCLVSCPQVGDEGLSALLGVNSNLQHLSLALNPSRLTDDGVSRAVRFIKRVRYLDFSGCTQLSRMLPSAVARHCQYLEGLSFASVADIGDDQLRCLIMKCANLMRLDISGCQAISEEGLLATMDFCSNLQRLNMSMLPNVSDNVVGVLRKSNAGCIFDRHASNFVDPDDLSGLPRVAGTTVVKKKKKPSRKTGGVRSKSTGGKKSTTRRSSSRGRASRS